MAGAARVGRDTVGPGLIIGPGSPTVFTNNQPASTVGDLVVTHGESPHVSPTITSGSGSVFINNKPAVAIDLSVATCGHAVTTASTDVFIGK